MKPSYHSKVLHAREESDSLIVCLAESQGLHLQPAAALSVQFIKMIFCTWLSDLNIMVCAVHILALLLAQQQAALYRASLTSVPHSVHI